MYTEHPVFEVPSDSKAKIWRYQDLAKLIAFLSAEALFFARADRLENPFEGSIPRANVEMRRQRFSKIRESGPVFVDEFQKHTNTELSVLEATRLAHEAASYLERSRIEENEAYRRFTCVNCWHVNNQESFAMWKLYCQGHEAVAIQSSFDRLTESLRDFPESIYGGLVQYTDYETDAIPTENDFYRFIYKRASFSHEKELRLVLQRHPRIDSVSKQVVWDEELFPNRGILIPVDPAVLVERIVISPTAPPWFEEIVNSVVEKYGFTFSVERSALCERPAFLSWSAS